MRKEIFEQGAHGQTMLTPYGEEVFCHAVSGIIVAMALAVIYFFVAF